MNHQKISLVFAIALFILVLATSGVFRFLFAAMILFCTALVIYNYLYLKRQNVFSVWNLVRILLFITAANALYFIFPGGFFRAVVLLIFAALFYFIELGIALSSEQIVFFETLLSYFGLSLGIFALSFYLLLKITWTLLALATLTYLIARGSLDYIPQPAAKKNFYAILIALAMLEISWGLLLLPLHFTAVALIAFNIFYVLWIITYYHLFNNLNKKKITFHLIFSTLIIFVLLLGTPWK